MGHKEVFSVPLYYRPCPRHFLIIVLQTQCHREVCSLFSRPSVTETFSPLSFSEPNVIEKIKFGMTRSLDSALPGGPFMPHHGQDTESTFTSTESLPSDDGFLNEEILSSSSLAPKGKCRRLRKMQSDITEGRGVLISGQEDQRSSG